MASPVDITALSAEILAIVTPDNYNTADLLKILTGISSYVSNPAFAANINTIVNIITTDRDGNNTFDINDLKLLAINIPVIQSIITSILAVISAAVGSEIKYNDAATEEFIYKLLAYIFLVIVPDKTKNPLTLEEKKSIVSILSTIYELIVSSGIIKTVVTEIASWFKTKTVAFCQCLKAKISTSDTVATQLPAVNARLVSNLNGIKHQSVLLAKIADLEDRLASVTQKPRDVNQLLN